MDARRPPPPPLTLPNRYLYVSEHFANKVRELLVNIASVGRTRREPVRVLHGSGAVLESLGQTCKELSHEIYDVNSEERRVKVTKKLR